MVGLEKGLGLPNLSHLGRALYSPSPGFRVGQRWKQQGGQYGNNRNDHQKFNQSERQSVAHRLGASGLGFLRMDSQVFHMMILF
jgi:hypothetical protein